MSGTPMKITLYGENDEVKGEFSRSFVPWKVLKKAVALMPSLSGDEMNEQAVDAIAELVVEAFGGQFTVDDLNDGADVGEMMAVVYAIVNRANPTMGQK